MSDPETNKANAQAFYDLVFNQCKPREAIFETGIATAQVDI